MSRPTLRLRLLLGFLLVVGMTGVVVVVSGLSFISRTILQEAMRRVEIDLGGAWAAFEAEKAGVQAAAAMASQGQALRNLLDHGGDPEAARRELDALRRRSGLDILNLVDASGHVVIRGRPGEHAGNGALLLPVVRDALAGRAASGTLLLSADALRREGDDLAERAYIPLVFTDRAVPTERTVEDRGMVLVAAMPVLEGDEVRGAVYGGILLNRKFALVDRIRDLVFGDATYAGKPVGTVTFFLGDVRIATNVMMDAGTRALGTRVSQEVYRKVLERGERFADRAFVVNDWYLSAYDPIRDPSGHVIGIIYVGLLEKRYLEYRQYLAREYLGISLLAVLLSVAAAIYISASLRRPVTRLLQATRALSAGHLDARVKVTRASREMAELSDSFNAMAEALEARTRELEGTSEALQKAYSEAADKNRAYLETLGFVTHELKSPLASIVFGIGSLRERILGPLRPEQEAALRSAAASADYLNDTIANYLNLSHLEEGSLRLKLERVSVPAQLVDPVLERLRELAHERRMRLAKSVPEGLEVECDRALIVSVVQNLVSNAVKYGREGGEVLVEAREEDGRLVLGVRNDGVGFAPGDAERLFQKFSRLARDGADTKSGTGLGLYVSKQIVEKHGGHIRAESEPGRFARFTFTLPRATVSVVSGMGEASPVASEPS